MLILLFALNVSLFVYVNRFQSAILPTMCVDDRRQAWQRIYRKRHTS
jgi:hypothetical protein